MNVGLIKAKKKLSVATCGGVGQMFNQLNRLKALGFGFLCMIPG